MNLKKIRKTPNVLVVIAARGGSKGVKNKNIRPILGKPLIAITIEQAVRWGRASRVIVSTDSSKIRNVAIQYGAEAPFLRAKRLATDECPKGLVIRDALLRAEAFYRTKFDLVMDLDATSPIRRGDDLERSLRLFQFIKPKTLFSVTHSHKNPYFNMVERTPAGGVALSKKLKGQITCRQDAPEVFSMNASIYIYDRNYLMRSRTAKPITNRSAIYVMDDLSSIDIDREIDFKFVEFLIRGKVVKL